MDAIEVKDLDVAYEQKYIIKNMNLEIPKGKITMIIGSNYHTYKGRNQIRWCES